MNVRDENIVAREEQLSEQMTLAAGLEDARARIAAKHAEMLRKLNAFESMERATAARNQAEKALKGAASVVDAAGAAARRTGPCCAAPGSGAE